MLSGSSISVVLEAYRPERIALLRLLDGLSPSDWDRPTECPAYDVKGIATHVLGDDLSLLSRQRDGSESGTALVAAELPGANLRTLLDTFNDRWVSATRFLSRQLLVELLGLTGEWTATFYEGVDPESPGESVGFFGAKQGSSSPLWHAIAREYMERWIHHSQIRRALGLGSLAEPPFLEVGIEVVAAVGGVEPGIPMTENGAWSLGPVVLGPAQLASDILTRGFTAEEVTQLSTGPTEAVALLSSIAGRQ